MRFLIVRIAAIGDVAMSTPLLSRIHAEYADAHVTWLCATSMQDMVALFPGVDETIAVDAQQLLAGNFFGRVTAVARVWGALAGRQFDRVLVLHPDPRYRILTTFVSAPLSAASHQAGPERNPVPGRFRGDEAARLLDERRTGAARHYAAANLRDRLPGSVLGPATRPRVALVPGGTRNVLRSDTRRRWPVASYAMLARQLESRGIEPVLVGDRTDEEMLPAFAGIRVTSLLGKTSLLGTLAVLRDVNALVTHDTGPMHLARLTRTPTVALFGPTDPQEFVAADDDITVIQRSEPLSCRPCYDGIGYPPCDDHVCMSGIRADDVMSAVSQRLG